MFSCGLWAVLGIGFIFAMTSLGSAAVFLFPAGHSFALQRVTMGFSAGIMTAASVWSLLLPAIAQAEADLLVPPWMPAAFGLLLGAFFLAGLELIQRRGEGERRSLLFAAVTLHNIPEGMAVGLAFALALRGEGLSPALALAFGIGIQNLPEGAAVSLPLCQRGMRPVQAFWRGILSGAVEPLFAALAVLAAAYLYPLMPWLLSFSAGAMLYVSARELLREAEGLAGSFAYMGGFTIMMLLDVALG
jgi:ZIP family zinc transporter